jgi:putative SOS response-associated peptidase YedK
LLPRFNIAPTQEVAIVTSLEAPRVEYVRWGLIPSWAKEASIGSRLINARAETVREKPAFRAAFLRRRCLILADGFYSGNGRRAAGAARGLLLYTTGQREPFTLPGCGTWRAPEGEQVRTHDRDLRGERDH